ncbi:MAG: amidase [Alphaproteobacteria bacterium]|nr:amidase [Alphaproteobacteria bacterium]
MTDEITHLSATEIAAQIRAKELSARTVMAVHQARIEAINPTLNAICTLNERALEEAEAVDRRLHAGEPPRPLDGVPFLAKDNIYTKGIRTTFGSRLMQDFVPDEDSVVVERLRAAGAVLLGKSNTPEFAHDVNTTNFLFGTTRNPWNLNVTAGGSSGGSGAAVAACLAPLALGTDLGGSIRGPASFNGLVGIRPAFGRVPTYPTDLPWGLLVTGVTGPLTRSVADAALMLSVLAGPDDRDPTTLPRQDLDYVAAAAGEANLTGRRLAYAGDLGDVVPVDPEVDELARAAAYRFRDLGLEVSEDSFDASDLTDIIQGTRGFGMVGRYADRYDAHKDLMTPPLLNQIEASLQLDLRTVTRAERLRGTYWQRVREFLDRYDYIVAPSIGVPPFRLDEPLPTEIGGRPVARYYDAFLSTYAFSVTGLPIVAVPCGLTKAGLPVGIQIVGRRYREDLVIEAAAAFEAGCPEHFQVPEIDLGEAKDLGEAFSSPGLVMERPM